MRNPKTVSVIIGALKVLPGYFRVAIKLRGCWGGLRDCSFRFSHTGLYVSTPGTGIEPR